MVRVFLAILLMLPFQIWAIDVYRDVNDHIIISGGSCAQMLEQVNIIVAWALEHKLDGSFAGSKEIKCQYKYVGPYKFNHWIDITDVVPKVIQDKLGVQAGFQGPNCWNNALFVNRILPAMTFSTGEEFNFWLSSPLCRPVVAPEALRAGDVYAIRRKADDEDSVAQIKRGFVEEHGFVHISDLLSFSKNGLDQRSPYVLWPLKSVEDLYQLRDPTCSRVTGVPASCKRWSNVYRCESFDEFAKKVVDPKLKEALQSVTAFQCYWQDYAPGVKANKAIWKLFYENLHVLQLWVEQQMDSHPDMAGEEKFLWQSVYVRVRSLKEQAGL